MLGTVPAMCFNGMTAAATEPFSTRSTLRQIVHETTEQPAPFAPQLHAEGTQFALNGNFNAGTLPQLSWQQP